MLYTYKELKVYRHKYKEIKSDKQNKKKIKWYTVQINKK